MSIKITGLNELERELNELSARAQRLEGNQNVPLVDLLTHEFIIGCSRFQSADELFSASGFKVESQEDFDAIPADQWDTFIQCNTSYSSWEELLGDAVALWTKKQLGL